MLLISILSRFTRREPFIIYRLLLILSLHIFYIINQINYTIIVITYNLIIITNYHQFTYRTGFTSDCLGLSLFSSTFLNLVWLCVLVIAASSLLGRLCPQFFNTMKDNQIFLDLHSFHIPKWHASQRFRQIIDLFRCSLRPSTVYTLTLHLSFGVIILLIVSSI